MSTNAGSIAKDKSWESKERGEEAAYIHEKDQAKLAAIRDGLNSKESEGKKGAEDTTQKPKDFEGGYGGQEDLEDRYATTSGMH